MKRQRAIIYLRKSTDREDRQQISIETQKQHCEKLAADYDLETTTIEDHKSAKDDGKRPGFKQLLSLCKKGTYDYVIAYDPTRISRNTIDAAYFTELINKNHIKGFYASESRQFFNGTDIFSALMLWISFLMSKADNQMRSSNTRRKMETLFQAGRVMAPTPFGYKNHQFFDEFGRIWHDVLVVEKEAEIMKKAFEMRLKWEQLKSIAAYFLECWYKKSVSTIEQMLKNPFYIGIQRGKLWEAEIRMPGYKPIISCATFEKVNAIRRQLRPKPDMAYDAHFRGMIYDYNGHPLISYETRNRYGNPYIYYRGQNRIVRRLNYSQKFLFGKMDDYMKGFSFPDGFISDMETVLNEEFKIDSWTVSERNIVLEELEDIELKRKSLMKKLLAEIITDEDYKETSLSLLRRKKYLEERITTIAGDTRSTRGLIIKWVKLLGSLLPAYATKNPSRKSKVLKGIQVELFAKDDLSLTIQENELLKRAKICWLCYGSPGRIRTDDQLVNSQLLYHWATEEYRMNDTRLTGWFDQKSQHIASSAGIV